MNLHAIDTGITPHYDHRSPRMHYHDFILDRAFFARDRDNEMTSDNYGALVEVWVENNDVFGIWVDNDGVRWRIYAYEYNNESDKEAIIANGDGDFTTSGWYVDEGHIPA